MKLLNKLMFFLVIILLITFVITITSCSNTKNIYKHYPQLPENKSDTFYLPYHFVE